MVLPNKVRRAARLGQTDVVAAWLESGGGVDDVDGNGDGGDGDADDGAAAAAAAAADDDDVDVEVDADDDKDDDAADDDDDNGGDEDGDGVGVQDREEAEDCVDLAGEVVEQGASGDLGRLGEVVHGEAVQTLLVGELLGAERDPVGGLRPAPRCTLDHVVQFALS